MSVPSGAEMPPVPRIGSAAPEDTLARFEAWSGGKVGRKTLQWYAREIRAIVVEGIPELRGGELLNDPAVLDAVRSTKSLNAKRKQWCAAALKKFAAFLLSPTSQPNSSGAAPKDEDEDEDEDEEEAAEYDVEEILEERATQSGEAEFKVKWKGYSVNHATWEPEEHLKNSSELLQDFRRRQEAQPFAAVDALRDTVVDYAPRASETAGQAGSTDCDASIRNDAGEGQEENAEENTAQWIGCERLQPAEDAPVDELERRQPEQHQQHQQHQPAVENFDYMRSEIQQPHVAAGTATHAAPNRNHHSTSPTAVQDDEEWPDENYIEFVQEISEHRQERRFYAEEAGIEYRVGLRRRAPSGRTLKGPEERWLPAKLLLQCPATEPKVKQYILSLGLGDGNDATAPLPPQQVQRADKSSGGADVHPAMPEDDVTVAAMASSQDRHLTEAVVFQNNRDARYADRRPDHATDHEVVRSERDQPTQSQMKENGHEDEEQEQEVRREDKDSDEPNEENPNHEEAAWSDDSWIGFVNNTASTVVAEDFGRAVADGRDKNTYAAHGNAFRSDDPHVADDCVKQIASAERRHPAADEHGGGTSRGMQSDARADGNLDQRREDPGADNSHSEEQHRFSQQCVAHANDNALHGRAVRYEPPDARAGGSTSAEISQPASAANHIDGQADRYGDGADRGVPRGDSRVQLSAAGHACEDALLNVDGAEEHANDNEPDFQRCISEILANPRYMCRGKGSQQLSIVWEQMAAEGWTREQTGRGGIYCFPPGCTRTNSKCFHSKTHQHTENDKVYFRTVPDALRYLQRTGWQKPAGWQKPPHWTRTSQAKSGSSPRRLRKPVQDLFSPPACGKRKRRQTIVYDPELEASKSWRRPNDQQLAPTSRGRCDGEGGADDSESDSNGGDSLGNPVSLSTIDPSLLQVRVSDGFSETQCNHCATEDQPATAAAPVAAPAARKRKPSKGLGRDGRGAGHKRTKRAQLEQEYSLRRTVESYDCTQCVFQQKDRKDVIWTALQREGWSSRYDSGSQCSMYYMPGADDNCGIIRSSKTMSADGKPYRMRGFSNVVRYLKATIWPAGLELLTDPSADLPLRQPDLHERSVTRCCSSSTMYKPQEVEGRHHGQTTILPIPEPDPSAYHIIVVGAGAAGLSATRKLVSEAGQLLDHGQQERKLVVTVLEGKDRVGGRIHTYLMGGEDNESDSKHGNEGNISKPEQKREQQPQCKSFPVDLGASFVHGCNKFNPIWRLAQDLNISLDTSEGGYSAGWGRGAPWLASGGKRIGIDKIHRIYSLYKDITAEVDRIAAREAEEASRNEDGSSSVGMNDNLGLAVIEARKVLERKFSKAHSMFETKETMQILESINVLWAGYCSSLDHSSLAMIVDENWDKTWDMPANRVATAETTIQQQPDHHIDADAQLAEELEDTQRRRSSRHSKLPSVAVEENERDESDGMVVGGYGPFLIDHLIRDIDTICDKHNEVARQRHVVNAKASRHLLQRQQQQQQHIDMSGGDAVSVAIQKGCVVKIVSAEHTGAQTRHRANNSRKITVEYAIANTSVSRASAAATVDGYGATRGRADSKLHELHADMVLITLPLGVLQQSVPKISRAVSTTAMETAPVQEDDGVDPKYAAIDFLPPLSTAKQEAIHALGMGLENKVLLRFPIDGNGLNHTSTSSNGSSHAAATANFARRTGPDLGPFTRRLRKLKYFQVADPKFRLLSLHGMDHKAKPGCLLVHVAPPHAATTHKRREHPKTSTVDGTEYEVVSEILELLRDIFGPSVHVPQPIEVKVTKWHHDPFALGAYSHMPPNATVMHKHEMLQPEGVVAATTARVSVDTDGGDGGDGAWGGRLLFAGEGCSIHAHQCVHGAFETGESQAIKMIKTLTSVPPTSFTPATTSMTGVYAKTAKRRATAVVSNALAAQQPDTKRAKRVAQYPTAAVAAASDEATKVICTKPWTTMQSDCTKPGGSDDGGGGMAVASGAPDFAMTAPGTSPVANPPDAPGKTNATNQSGVRSQQEYLL